MLTKIFITACCIAGASATPAQTGAASAPAPAARSNGGDQFVAAGNITLREPVGGDLFGAGGSIDVDANVAGDAVLAGGRLRIGASVAHSVIAGGGQVTLNAEVGRNVRAVGGQVEFGPGSRIVGNVSVAGGQLNLRGAVLGQVQAAGGRVFIDGPVSGNVVAAAGQVELGPNARIAGSLRYRSGDSLRRDPAAQVLGSVEQLPPLPDDDHDDEHRRAHRFGQGWHGAGLFATFGLVLLAAAWLAALPGWSARVSQTLQARLGLSALLGLALLVCSPFAALLLIVTIVGIPLGLLGVALMLAVLPIAYVSAAIGLGDWALRRWRADTAQRFGWRLGATAAALIGLALLAWVPWVGGLIVFAALLAGLGAMLLQLRRGAQTA